MAKGNTPKKIIIHNSVSEYGNADIIRKWHMNGNKWSSIGYHYIIKNGYNTWTDKKENRYNADCNGYIEYSLPIKQRGIHCKGQNTNSVGICIIGGKKGESRSYYSGEQLDSLILKVSELMYEFNIPVDKIYPHSKFSTKTCPNFDVELLKSHLEGKTSYSDLYEHFTGDTFNPDEDTKYFMDSLNIT